MTDAYTYFRLGQAEENAGRSAAAILFYISSFCASYNRSRKARPYASVSKIRAMQRTLRLSDGQLLEIVSSYGPLTDTECRYLLYYSIYGFLPGIRVILDGADYD